MNILGAVLHDLGELPATQVYVVAGLILAAEAGLLLGIFAPAATTLFTLGFLAHTGHIDVLLAMVFACLAAALGDSIGYWEGRLLGKRAETGWLARRIGAGRREHVNRLFERFGGRAVMVGRWVAFVRTIMPRLAGMSRLSYRRFLLWNIIGILVWIPGSIGIGYLAGSSYQNVIQNSGRLNVVIGAVLAAAAVIIAAYIAVKRFKHPGLSTRRTRFAAGITDPTKRPRLLHPPAHRGEQLTVQATGDFVGAHP